MEDTGRIELNIARNRGYGGGLKVVRGLRYLFSNIWAIFRNFVDVGIFKLRRDLTELQVGE
eukprot:1376797-Amorphochlora_amoeboformis.AAC.1